MKVQDIANEIYIEAGSPSSTSIPAISFWVRAKVGALNNILFESFTIDSVTYEIVDGCGAEINPEAVAIIKQMYRVYDYEIQIRSNMNSLAGDSILEVTDQGSSVKKVNRNEVSKTLAQVRKDESTALNNLITSYRLRGAGPKQVAGDDTQVGHYDGGNMIYVRSL